MAGEEIALKEYVDRRFDDQEKAVQAALVAADKGVSAALASAEKAVDKAESSSEKWRASANEWRGAMSDRERDFLTRREFYTMLVTAIAAVSLILAFVAR
jgi:hypothetical protein